MLVIRPETAADAEAIEAVQLAAFPTPAEAALVRALRAGGRASVSLVASLDDAIVGHALLSPVQLAGACTAPGGLGLAPIAVLPECQGQGIGGWLIVEAAAAARRALARFIVVLGEPGYYTRFGFEPASRYGLANEYQAGDAFMVRQLQPGALPPEGGLVRYAPEFAMLDSAAEYP